MPMMKLTVFCTFPKERIREPILYNLGQSFRIVPNIRQASISDEIGLVKLELEGDEAEVERALKYLRERNVKIDVVTE